MKAGGSSRKDGILFYGEHYIVNLQYDKKKDEYRYGLIARNEKKEKEDSDNSTHTDVPAISKAKKAGETAMKKIPGAKAAAQLMKNGTLAASAAIGLVGAVGSAMAYNAPKWSLRRTAGNLLMLSEVALEGYLLSRIYGRDGKVWSYHGAEHKVINAMEAGNLQAAVEKKQPLITFEEAKAAPRVADRCGSNLVHYLTVSEIAVQMIPFGSEALKSVLSLVAAYKLFNMPEEDCPTIKQPINVWGGLIQKKILTREPDDQILEGAVQAMNLLIQAENGTLSQEEKERFLGEGKKIDPVLRMMC